MKKWKKCAWLFLVIVLMVNYIPPIKGILDMGQTYHYTTLHGEVQPWEMPSKQPQFEGAVRKFEFHKSQHPGTTDTVLYRTFKKSPLIIWHWHEYFFHPRYKLPYLDPQHIQS